MKPPSISEEFRGGLANLISNTITTMNVDELHSRVSEDWEAFMLDPPGFDSFPGCSNVRSDVVKNATLSKVTLFDENVLRADKPWKISMAGREADPRFQLSAGASVLERGFSYVFDHELGLTDLFRRDTLTLCVQGYVVFKVKRNQRLEWRPIEEAPDKPPTIQQVVLYDGPEVELVPFDKFFCDVAYEDIQDAAFLYQEIKVPASTLRFWMEYAEKEGWDEDAVEAAILEAGQAEGVDDEMPEDRAEEDPMVTIQEWYGEIPPEYTGWSGPVRLWGYFDQRTESLLFVHYLRALDAQNRYPFEVPVLYPSDEQGKRWWGYGVPRWNKPLSDIVDDALNRARDWALLHDRPPIVTSDDDSVLRDKIIQLEPWARIRCDRVDSIKFLELPAQSRQAQLEQLSIFQSRYERVTQVFPEQMGDISGLKSHTTTGNVSQILQAAAAPHIMDGFRIAEAYQRLLRRVALIRSGVFWERINFDLENLKDEELFRNLGVVEPLLRLFSQQEAILFGQVARPDLVESEYLWEFDVAKLQVKRDAQASLEALRIITERSPMSQSFPDRVHAVIVRILQLLDVPFWQEFIISEEEAIQRAGQIQLQAIMAMSPAEAAMFVQRLPQEAQVALLQKASSGMQQAQMSGTAGAP